MRRLIDNAKWALYCSIDVYNFLLELPSDLPGIKHNLISFSIRD